MLIGYDPAKFHFEVSLFSPDDLKLHTKFRETSLFETFRSMKFLGTAYNDQIPVLGERGEVGGVGCPI